MLLDKGLASDLLYPHTAPLALFPGRRRGERGYSASCNLLKSFSLHRVSHKRDCTEGKPTSTLSPNTENNQFILVCIFNLAWDEKSTVCHCPMDRWVFVSLNMRAIPIHVCIQVHVHVCVRVHALCPSPHAVYPHFPLTLFIVAARKAWEQDYCLRLTAWSVIIYNKWKGPPIRW